MNIFKWLVFISLVILITNNIEVREVVGADSQQEMICDNGLDNWLKSDSIFGQWVAKSVRIVKTKKGKYQPQFKDYDDKKAEWTELFENGEAFSSLIIAQYKIRISFEIKKEICDSFQNLHSE